MQILAKQDSVLVQLGIASQDAFPVIIGLSVDAQPDLARLDMRIEQIENHIRLQNAVAPIGSQMLAHLSRERSRCSLRCTALYTGCPCLTPRRRARRSTRTALIDLESRDAPLPDPFSSNLRRIRFEEGSTRV